MSTTHIDFEGRYAVDGYDGIAFYLRGYATTVVETEFEDEGQWYYDQATISDPNFVRAVMVGDDRVHIIDVDDLTPISEDDYCDGCGQIGCGWHS